MKITIDLNTEEDEKRVMEYFINSHSDWLNDTKRVKEIKVEGKKTLIFNGKKVEEC